MRVSELMVSNPKVVHADQNTIKAMELMRETGTDLLAVVNGETGRHFRGAITAQTIRDGCLAQGHDPTRCVVADHLSSLVSLHPEEDLTVALPPVEDALGPDKVASVVGDHGELLGLITRADLALEMARAAAGHEASGRTLVMELISRCLQCGWTVLRQQPLPDACPRCGAPKENFALVTED